MIDATAAPGRFPLLPLVVLIVIAIVATISWQRLRSTGRSLVLGVLAVAAIAYVAVGQIETLSGDGGASYFGPPMAGASPPPDDVEATVVDVAANQVFPIAITVANTGYLSVTIQGLDITPKSPNIGPHYVGARLLRDPNVIDVESGVVAFQPTTVAPGAMLTVVALIDAGPCARRGGTAGWYTIDELPIAYDVLGWPRTLRVAFPHGVAIAAGGDCNATSP